MLFGGLIFFFLFFFWWTILQAYIIENCIRQYSIYHFIYLSFILPIIYLILTVPFEISTTTVPIHYSRLGNKEVEILYHHTIWNRESHGSNPGNQLLAKVKTLDSDKDFYDTVQHTHHFEPIRKQSYY